VKVSVLQRKVALNYEDHVIRIVKDVTREEELRTSLLKKSDEFERQVLEIKNQVREYRLAARKFVDRLLEGVVRMDCAGNILECNPAAARLFRYPASDELIGVNFFTDLRLDDHSSPGLADFLEGTPLNEPVEVSFTAFDGSRVHALVSCAWVDERKRDMAEFLLLDLSEAHRLRSDLAALRRETEYILREHEEELKRTQQQLIDHAHRAGMAVVASEVLHNIGNAVNSIGIRLRELADLLEREKVPERLSLLAEKQSGAPDSQDSIQRYVAMLARAVESSRERLRSNVEFIAGKLSHISEIISLQQSIASIRGIIEEVKVTDLILDAVEMNREVMEKRGIVVTYRFADIPPIKVEKNKLLQVLVNLIKNAVEAIDMAGPEARKEITVGVAPSQDGSQVVITVTDTGIGMTEEVLANLFSFGYTTKRDRGGSGFGLHSSSNLLKAMGGSLSARSDGPGKGAVFTVTVPLEPRIEGNGGA
jgi:signal transduction histidine kinase